MSLLCFRCWASLLPMFRTFTLSWFLQIFVIKSYTYGICNPKCKARVGIRLGKVPILRRIVFCRRCNLIPGWTCRSHVALNQCFVECSFRLDALSFAIQNRVDSDEYPKCPSGDRIYMRSPCNFPIENYTEIFYICNKGNVPAFQCKMSLERSMSAGEVHGLSVIFITSYPMATGDYFSGHNQTWSWPFTSI